MSNCRFCRDIIFYSPSDLGISMFHFVIALGPCILVVALLFKLERLNTSLQYRASRSIVDIQQEHQMSISSPRRRSSKRKSRRMPRKTNCCGRCLDRTKRLFVVGTKGTLLPQYYRLVVIAVASILVLSIWSVIVNTSNETECVLNRKSESINIQIVDLFLRTLYRFAQFVTLFALMSSCFRMVSSPSMIGFSWTFPIVGSIISSIVPLFFTLIAHSALAIDLRLESEVVLESCHTNSPPDYKRSVWLWIFRDTYDSLILLSVLFVYVISTTLNAKPGVPAFFRFCNSSFIVYPRPSLKLYALLLLFIRILRLTAVITYISDRDSWRYVCLFAIPYFLENIILPISIWVSLAKDTAYLQGLRDDTLKFEAALLGWGQNVSDHTFEINWQEIRLHRKLSPEGTRNVFAASWLGTPVAVKEFRILKNAPEMLWASKDLTKTIRRAVLREVTILSSLSHPNIVQFLGCSLNVPEEKIRSRRRRRGTSSSHVREDIDDDASSVWIVTELLKGRTLYESVRSRRRVYTLQSVLRLSVDIAKGMVFIHSRNVTHGDLKSSNILLSGSGASCKIIDFGESAVVDALSDESGGGGTLGWNAPERLTQSSNHTKKSDVWSWAIVVRTFLLLLLLLLKICSERPLSNISTGC